MCGRLPACRTHFSCKIGAVLGLDRNCWLKRSPPSWIDRGVCFFWVFIRLFLWVSIWMLFVCTVVLLFCRLALDWSLCFSPEMKSFLSASRLKCLTAAQELRFATLWCDARLLPGWRLAFLGDSSRKRLLEKGRATLAPVRGKKNIIKPKQKASFEQTCFHLEFRQISRRRAVHWECDSSATKPKCLHLWCRRHLPRLPAFCNLSICELYVLILWEIWERCCSKHKKILYYQRRKGDFR